MMPGASFPRMNSVPEVRGFPTHRGCAGGNFHYGGGVPTGFEISPSQLPSIMSARLDFRSRHLGHIGTDRDEMLRETGYPSLAALIELCLDRVPLPTEPSGVASMTTCGVPL